MPLVMKPTERSPYSTLFTGKPFASSAMRFRRASTATWRLIALPGIMTYFAMSFSYGMSGLSSRPRSSTGPREWERRVVLRRITGVSYASLSAYAYFTKSLASWLSEGSSTGIMAALATMRVSCSFWELYMPGSSAATRTMPPRTPVYAAV